MHRFANRPLAAPAIRRASVSSGRHRRRSCSPMRLSDILKPQNIKIPLQSKTKTDAITELVGVLAANGDVADSAKVLESVLEREATRTTGIGNGLAIPHGKTNGVTGLAMAIGKPSVPIDFQAIDGRPVTIIWLLSSPPDKTGPHIHALADQPADDDRQVPPGARMPPRPGRKSSTSSEIRKISYSRRIWDGARVISPQSPDAAGALLHAAFLRRSSSASPESAALRGFLRASQTARRH